MRAAFGKLFIQTPIQGLLRSRTWAADVHGVRTDAFKACRVQLLQQCHPAGVLLVQAKVPRPEFSIDVERWQVLIGAFIDFIHLVDWQQPAGLDDFRPDRSQLDLRASDVGHREAQCFH